MSNRLARYKQILQTPQGRALLNTIRYAEGTPGESGYRTMFGGGKFNDLSRHPDQVIRSGGYASAAAGAYQFLPGTWQGVSKELGLKRFGPEEQDLAALRLIDRRGALDPFLRGEKFGTVINKLAPEWASLPTAAGGSYYGQPSKPLGQLYDYYQKQKEQIAGTPTVSAPVAQAPATKRSVEDILSSTLGGVPNVALEQRNQKANSLAGSLRDAMIKSLLPGLINPFGMF